MNKLDSKKQWLILGGFLVIIFVSIFTYMKIEDYKTAKNDNVRASDSIVDEMEELMWFDYYDAYRDGDTIKLEIDVTNRSDKIINSITLIATPRDKAGNIMGKPTPKGVILDKPIQPDEVKTFILKGFDDPDESVGEVLMGSININFEYGESFKTTENYGNYIYKTYVSPKN